MKRLSLLFCLVSFFSFPGYSWLYPEHRDIMIRAISGLDSAHRMALDQLWALARNGHESRLSGSVIDPGQGISPQHLDFASWPAISGDHSCSPQNMVDIVLYSEWIMKVADIAARLKRNIARSRDSTQKENFMREADMKLLRADPGYVSRAGSNNGHFMLALPDIAISDTAYMVFCLHAGAPLNLLGIYSWCHISAMEAAVLLRRDDLTDQERAAFALTVLSNEAFAIHFLEDGFASGHVAGIWGDASQRKGTHDFYNANGFQVTTWSGDRLVLMGDAYMRPQDEEIAARSVRASIEQVLDLISESGSGAADPVMNLMTTPDTFNVCRTDYMPFRSCNRSFILRCGDIIVNTPAPGLESGLGSMPRTRSELGPFIGAVSGIRTSVLNHGFGKYQSTGGAVPALEVAVRIGIGLEGLLNQASDGLIFLDAGWRLDGPSSMRASPDSVLKKLGSFGSAVPGRSAFLFRLRMPFYLIPGDLLILAPILMAASQESLNKVITTAGNGGLIPWQTKIISSIGSFQFILGREAEISLYGYGSRIDGYLLPYNDLNKGEVCSFNSAQICFPIVEYKMAGSYRAGQSSDLLLQLYWGVDIPYNRKVLYPVEAPVAPVKNIYFVGLRLGFDYRHYFGKNQ